jgi:hypothetical protein
MMKWCNLMSRHESRGVPASRGLTLSAAVLAWACGVALPAGSAWAQVQTEQAQKIEERRQQIDQARRARMSEAEAAAASQAVTAPSPTPVGAAQAEERGGDRATAVPWKVRDRPSPKSEGTLELSASKAMPGGAVDIEYSGGSVGDFLRRFQKQLTELRESEGESRHAFNVLAHPLCDGVRMPAVSLRGVDPAAALRGLAGLIPGIVVEVAGEGFRMTTDPNDPGGTSVVVTVSINSGAVLNRDWIYDLPTPPTVDLEFKGGTLREYFDAAVAAGAPLRIVYASEAVASLRMPPVSVRGVTAEEVRQVAEQSLNPPGGGRAVLEVAPRSEAALSEPLIIVRDLMYVEREVSEVYDLSEIDSSTPVEDVLSAIEVAVEINNASVSLKYHEPTRLLLVKGTPSAIEPLSRVIEQLRGRRRAAPRQQP